MKINLKTILVYFCLLLPIPGVALADAGIPMIFLTFPAMLMAFMQVVLIESGVLKKILKIKFSKSFWASLAVNMISTVPGIPLARGFLLILEMLTTKGSCGPGFSNIGTSVITAIVESAWLCPHEGNLNWLIPAAFVINIIVAFFISVLIS